MANPICGTPQVPSMRSHSPVSDAVHTALPVLWIVMAPVTSVAMAQDPPAPPAPPEELPLRCNPRLAPYLASLNILPAQSGVSGALLSDDPITQANASVKKALLDCGFSYKLFQSFGMAATLARVAEFLPVPPLTRDQVKLLRRDNVVYRRLDEPGAVSPIIMSTRKGDRSPEISLVLKLVKDMYKKEGITFGV